MPRRHTSLTSLFKAQTFRFEACKGNLALGMETLRRESLRELDELVSGPGFGKARIKALRAAGHPYGRLDHPLDTAKHRFGAQRYRRQKGTKEEWPTWPVGIISGKLRQSKFASIERSNGFKLTLGFNQRAGRAIWRVYPGGTKWMVDSGIWGPNEGGELGKRMKKSRLAFRKTFFDPLKKP